MQLLSTFTDEQLVKAYVDGNNEAFDALLRRHQTKLFTYILRIVRNRDVADDVFQDTFVKAITMLKQGRYTENGKFSAWLHRIAHNLIIDYYRQERVENTVSADGDDTDMLNRRDLCDTNVEDWLVEHQIHTDVRRLIHALPEPQRQVLTMRYYRDMSFKEIAAATGVSINTALGRMRYALLNMRRMAAKHHIQLTP